MATLEIEGCGDCPLVKFSNYDEEHNYVGDDMVFVRCTHQQQQITEGRSVKIKNLENSFYFPCPLEKNIEDEE